MQNSTPTIIEVKTSDAGLRDEMAACVSVHPIWSGVDRPDTGGFVVKDQRMADRLVAAILAGVVYSEAEVKTDVNGKTYVAASKCVYGKRMNADLKRLGF